MALSKAYSRQLSCERKCLASKPSTLVNDSIFSLQFIQSISALWRGALCSMLMPPCGFSLLMCLSNNRTHIVAQSKTLLAWTKRRKHEQNLPVAPKPLTVKKGTGIMDLVPEQRRNYPFTQQKENTVVWSYTPSGFRITDGKAG